MLRSVELARTGMEPARAVQRALAVAASLAVGVGLGLLDPGVDAFLVIAIAFAALGPLAFRLAREGSVFEPLVVAGLAFAVMYAVRPAAIVASPELATFKGYDISGQVTEALVIALVAVVAFQVGYMLPWARALAGRLGRLPDTWATDTTVAFSFALTVVGMLLFSAFLASAGGLHVVVEMVQGRSGSQESYFRNSSAYLYGGLHLTWPASLLLFAVGLERRNRVLIALAILVVLPFAVFSGGRGARITLLPLLLAPVVYYYLHARKRPRPIAVVIAAYLLFTVGIAFFRDSRVADNDVDRLAVLQHAITHPQYEFDQLVFNGVDNDMFESLAIETIAVPEHVPANPIDYFTRIAAKPIPSIVWPGKPLDPDERLNDYLFPNEQSRASSSTGVVGSFYLAGALPGVIVGMLVLGIALRVPWEYWRRFPDSNSAMLLLSASLMFVPILLRGGIGDTLARALFGIAPLLVAFVVCTSRAPREETA